MCDPENSIRFLVSGKRACFTRPEMRAERVSYDVITPSAARGLIESIHWKPAIRWVVDRIHVLNPISFQSLKINEIGSKISERNARTAMNRNTPGDLGIDVSDAAQRIQRSTLLLRNVAYGIEAHFEMTDRAGPEDNPGKHLSIFARRLVRGQHFRPPVLGLASFPADIEEIDIIPMTGIPDVDATRDLGWMFYDYDYGHPERRPRFFRAKMENGIIDVAAARNEGLIA